MGINDIICGPGKNPPTECSDCGYKYHPSVEVHRCEKKSKKPTNPFTEEYYKSLNYTDYLSRQDKYFHLAKDLTDLLDKLSLIDKYTSILDYGCATGFLLAGFQKLGYVSAYGYDISEWCENEIKSKNLSFYRYDHCLKKGIQSWFDILICLDVLEHMTDEDIKILFDHVKSGVSIIRVPVVNANTGEFVLDVSKRDPTHINKKTKQEWKVLLLGAGYTTILDLNLSSIYDSKGVMCCLCIK